MIHLVYVCDSHSHATRRLIFNCMLIATHSIKLEYVEQEEDIG